LLERTENHTLWLAVKLPKACSQATKYTNRFVLSVTLQNGDDFDFFINASARILAETHTFSLFLFGTFRVFSETTHL